MRKVSLLIVLVLVIAFGAVAGYFFQDLSPFCTTPTEPTAEEKQTQETFVLEHLPDARNLVWTIADCDDDGVAYLDFTTSLAPNEARDAFLGGGCTYHSTEEYDDVSCVRGSLEVVLFFELVDDKTEGELVFPHL